MRIVIAAVGRIKSGPEFDLVEDYLGRARALGRNLGFSDVRLADVEAPKGLTGAVRQAREGELLLKSVPAGSRLIALDERGEAQDSAAFSKLLAKWRDEGASCAGALIGGADGLTAQVRERADKVLSFGRATFPHLLVRAMLAEQTYRAMTILSGHPYHRA
ncbi:MAG: 23S rRNA (pseudouridine(1915)-N(3))-methyltransferase RlmH [Parvularculaceae bacterium]